MGPEAIGHFWGQSTEVMGQGRAAGQPHAAGPGVAGPVHGPQRMPVGMGRETQRATEIHVHPILGQKKQKGT